MLDDPTRERPGIVKRLRGIIFQSDSRSTLGTVFIRPSESLDRWVAGLRASDEAGALTAPLAMHAGLRVEMEDGRDFVVEQLAGGARDVLQSGLHWTPLASFQERDHPQDGGWDATVPVEAFRGVDARAVAEAIDRLRTIQGRPFYQEDCTTFLGRVFGERRLFADSPLLRSMGIAMRSGEPALPLIRPDATFDERTERLLRTDTLRALPDPEAEHGSVSVRQAHHRLLAAAAALGALGVAAIVWNARTRRSRFRGRR